MTEPPESPLVDLLVINRHLEERLAPRWRDMIRREMWEFLGGLYAERGGQAVPDGDFHVLAHLPPITGVCPLWEMAKRN